MRLNKHWMLHYETTKQSESCPSVGSFLIHPDVDHTHVGHPNHLTENCPLPWLTTGGYCWYIINPFCCAWYPRFSILYMFQELHDLWKHAKHFYLQPSPKLEHIQLQKNCSAGQRSLFGRNRSGPVSFLPCVIFLLPKKVTRSVHSSPFKSGSPPTGSLTHESTLRSSIGVTNCERGFEVWKQDAKTIRSFGSIWAFCDN